MSNTIRMFEGRRPDGEPTILLLSEWGQQLELSADVSLTACVSRLLNYMNTVIDLKPPLDSPVPDGNYYITLEAHGKIHVALTIKDGKSRWTTCSLDGTPIKVTECKAE